MPSSQRLRYLEADPRTTPAWGGDKEPRGTLVLLHAFPLNAGMWDPQFTLAEHGWHVVAPCLRGFDGSAPPIPALTMDDHAADVADLLGTIGTPAVVCGLSMGGYVALALYRQAPALFRGLILADTRAEADSPEARENRKRTIRLLATAGTTGLADADDMLPRLLGSTTRVTRPDLEARVRELIDSNTADGLTAALRAMMTRSDSTSLLATITVPTLILVGEEDVLTPPALSTAMASAIAGAELTVLPRAGHLASLEQPQAFNGAVARFLHRL